MRDIILLTAVAIASFLAIRRPSFGLLTFAFLGFLVPQSYTWGFARTFPFSQIVAVSTILGIFLSSEKKTFFIRRETFLLISLWAFFGLSSLTALYPTEAFDQFVLVSKIFLMIIVATTVINTEEKLNWLIRVVGYSLGFYGLKGGFFAIISGGEFIVWGPENSFLFANNSIGLGLAMNIPILLYLLKIEQSIWLRWLLRLSLILTYPAIVCTYSRGAWLGMVIVTVATVVRSKRKVLAIASIGIVALAFEIFVSPIAPERLQDRYDTLVNYQEDASAQSRFWNWEFCKRVGIARPVSGAGFDFYRLESYATFYPEFLARWPGKVWSCHSTWLTVFAEHGLPGAVIWLLLLMCSIKSLKQIRANAVNTPQSHSLDFVDMVQNSLLGYIVVGTFIDAAYFDILYYLVGFIIIKKEILLSQLAGNYLAPPLRAGVHVHSGSQLQVS